MRPLLLSLFPGIDLLGLAFQEVWPEACIVRGPDLIFGTLHDIRNFHPPQGVFCGLFGGPPCQCFSSLAALNRAQGREPHFGNMIPEFERVVAEAQPEWFVMENVPKAPAPEVPGYQVHTQILNNRWLGEEQNRTRAISFGTRDGRPLHIQLAALEPPMIFRTVTSNNGGKGGPSSAIRARRGVPTVTAGGGLGPGARGVMRGYPTVTSSDGGAAVRMWRYKLPDACRLQGLPEDFLSDAPFTAEGKLRAVANGVPLPMGRAIARAVRRAMGPQERG